MVVLPLIAWRRRAAVVGKPQTLLLSYETCTVDDNKLNCLQAEVNPDREKGPTYYATQGFPYYATQPPAKVTRTLGVGRKIVAAIRKCYIGLGVCCTGTLCVSVAGAERLKGLRPPFCTEGTITGDGKRGAAESSRKASDKVNHQRPQPLRRPARRRKERLYNQQRSYGNGKDRERAGTSKQATDRCSADRSINLQ